MKMARRPWWRNWVSSMTNSCPLGTHKFNGAVRYTYLRLRLKRIKIIRSSYQCWRCIQDLCIIWLICISNLWIKNRWNINTCTQFDVYVHQVFPDPVPIVCELVTETLTSIDPSIPACIATHLQSVDTPLDALIELKQATERFAQSLQSAIASHALGAELFLVLIYIVVVLCIMYECSLNHRFYMSLKYMFTFWNYLYRHI